MTLHDYVRICRRRWASILLTVAIAVIATAIIALLQPVSYASTTKIYVSAATEETLEDRDQGRAVAGQRVATYADLVMTPAVLDPVIESLQLSMSSAELAENIDAEASTGTSLLEITATAGDAEQAADIADATSTSLRALVSEVEGAGEDRAASGLAVVQEAEVPAQPQSSQMVLILGLGLAAGLVFGLGVAFLREALDPTVRTRRDLEDLTSAPLLGVIRSGRARPGQKERTAPGQVDAVASFRELRTRLMFGKPAGSPSAYVITSSVEREGRTTVAVNLARSLVDGDRRTLLVGADFGHPDLVQRFGVRTPPRGQGGEQTAAGLSEVLDGTAFLEDVIINDAEPGLDILPAGRGTDPRRMASRLDPMAALLEGCAETYDVTIIDAPALLSDSDVELLAQITTGVIVVARYGEVTRAELSAGLELLARARARLVGVVFTGVPRRGPDSLRGRRSAGPGQRRRDRDRAEGQDPSDAGGTLSDRAAGLSSARRRRLPDGTLSLSEISPDGSRVVALPQDRT